MKSINKIYFIKTHFYIKISDNHLPFHNPYPKDHIFFKHYIAQCIYMFYMNLIVVDL